MRILLVGGGGREHALAWKLRQSAHCDTLYAAPGNAGIAQLAECVPIAPKAISELVAFAQQNAIDLVVVGPESPLIAGLADALHEANIPCFGPSRAAAQLEGSKAFAKHLMAQVNAPTAPFAVFDQPEEAHAYLRERFIQRPCVIKADGEALGKGVFVCETLSDALDAVEFLMVERGLGEAGQRIVIEDRLHGREMSLLCLTDGNTASPMPPVRDYKRALDGDRGPNTGGMGCYTPLPDATPELIQTAMSQIVRPVIAEMARRGTPYQGVLYAGLMVQDEQPYTLEFNCRFGDPETQVLMPLLESDLIELAMATIAEQLHTTPLQFSNRAAVCVVLASGGYPHEYRTGLPIEGLEAASQLPNVQIFHAGTRAEGGRIVTSGGRVLNIVGLGATLADARENAYRAVEQIQFEGMHYRSDIAQSVL
ncbi:MAG: phosphoribosylamine--glycine ligase [Armatimonadetes bacterium JP3_11]|nr:MAG: phosphoribosylamine--glycine ligase [Armatimonadetes bacterium JP3_11]RMH10041.1 MAG: phosphoribosylamine--glycine ligase [Armatimonadota bacterium]